MQHADFTKPLDLAVRYVIYGSILDSPVPKSTALGPKAPFEYFFLVAFRAVNVGWGCHALKGRFLIGAETSSFECVYRYS